MPPIEDSRVIAPDAPQYNATLVRRVDQTDDLAYFWVKLDDEPIPFASGQYMTIGVLTDDRILQRPYSVASAPRVAGSEGYEFYVRHVPIVRFTTALWRLPVGHRMRMIGPKGRFMLEPDDTRTHLYVSTGTGIAPFLSMIRETQADDDPRRTVLLHGASYVDEIGYQEELDELIAAGYPLTFVPTVSRAGHARNAGWDGRTGRVEANVASVCEELDLRPEATVVYICGNPEMILNVEAVLMDRGFPEFHVKKELYWPKGKGVPAAAGAGAATTTG
ncbi:MAG TPA: FAD-binding oxidoreductase [Candidatus Limnocylindrales bacterium]|nr:FAD-binding oxidoreductase [Candidatus Limnocylindrales bacterium]